MLLIVCLPLHNNIGRLFGYYLTQASPTPFVALLSLISTNVAGWTKKTTVAAFYLIGYCAGNIIGPQTFRPKDAPRYVPAEIVIVRLAPTILIYVSRSLTFISIDRMLGPLHRRYPLHLLVLQATKQEESSHPRFALICQVGESRMVGSHRS